MNHPETTLQLQFCKWLKRTHPEVTFVRHEREQKRTPYMQNIFRVMNNGIDKLPDFEAFIGNGFYIEFKAPGKKWLLKDGKTVKPEYSAQYGNHKLLWSIGRVVYFCNDLEVAKSLYNAYVAGMPYPMQDYLLPFSDMDRADQIAQQFFK